ncbi:MAG: hypothetical protein JWQ74_1845 [Marmoricola sp.]|nr:hypothetical protein [Marmoricola sp.]
MSESLPPSSPEQPTPPAGRSVPLKWVGIGVAGLVVLGAAFFAGTAYENHRIKSSIEDAFSGFGDDFADTSDSTDDDSDAVVPDPVELTDGTPIEVTTDEGSYTVTVLSRKLNDEPSSDEALTRNLEYRVKVTNTGDKTLMPSLSAHYETDEGQVLDGTGVTCDEPGVPFDDLDPGQFVQGCESSDLPDAAGRLVLDGASPELYLRVAAAR